MIEQMAGSEFPNDERYLLVVEAIARDLFASEKLFRLSEQDFRELGWLGAEETLLDFVASKMRFGESLQSDAFALLCQELPPQ